MLGKIILPVEFCNRNTIRSDRLEKIKANMTNLGFNEVAERLEGRRNPLYGLLRQCQLMGGNYQKLFDEIVFHPIHPYLYSKRYQLIILRLFEGDISEYPISTMVEVPSLKPHKIRKVGSRTLYWGIANKLSELDEFLFGQNPQEILLPGDVANVFGLEVLRGLRSPLL